MAESAFREAHLGASSQSDIKAACAFHLANYSIRIHIEVVIEMRTRNNPIDTPATISMDPTEGRPPPRLLVLPKRATTSASLVTLAHPRTLEPTRYYFCPDTGVYEFTRIAAPKSSLRSWFLSPADVHGGDTDQGEQSARKGKIVPSDTMSDISENGEANGYVIKTGEIYAATPIDPLFLLLPVLCPKPTGTKSGPPKILFLSSDDLFEKLAGVSKDFGTIAKNVATRDGIQRRLEIVCDSVEAGDERMYRLSPSKLLQDLCVKAKRAVSRGLPASLEEKFVRKALEVPMMSAKRQDLPTVDPFSEDSTSGAPISSFPESQSSASTSLSEESISSESTTITMPDQPSPPDIPSEVSEQLRLKTAISYMLEAYFPIHLVSSLKELLASPNSPVNLTLCDEHLAHIAKLRAEAQASRSLGDFSRKRSMNEDDEARESREEKKRRKEEEEKRKKAGMSKGVRDLQKVNTSGMKKMSDFFGKTAMKKG